MQQRLTVVTLGVDSLRRSKKFYLDGLGWNEVDQESDDIVFIQMAGMVLALYPHHGLADDIGVPATDPVDVYRGVTLAYNTESEAEVDEVLALVVECGGTLIKGAETVFWGGYSGYFADPDGHLWEVVYGPDTQPESDGSFYVA